MGPLTLVRFRSATPKRMSFNNRRTIMKHDLEDHGFHDAYQQAS